MTFSTIKLIAERFINEGIVPLIIEEVTSANHIPVSDVALIEAKRNMNNEVSDFFASFVTIEEFKARLANMPTKSYLRVRIAQHLMMTWLSKLDDAIQGQLSSPVMAVESSPSVPTDDEQVWQLLRSHFGLTEQEFDKILKTSADKAFTSRVGAEK